MCIFVQLVNVLQRVRFIRLLEMPRRKWTKESSERHWQQRPSRVILRSTNVRQLNETRAARRSERLRKKATRKEDFLRAFRVPRRSNTSKRIFTEIANDLNFWAEHGGSTYCTRCGSLRSKKLLPAFRKRTQPASSKSCTCTAGRYKGASPEESYCGASKSDHGRHLCASSFSRILWLIHPHDVQL